MPRNSAKRNPLLSAAIAGMVMTSAGLVGVGCDDANTVDRRVRQSITESRVARMAGDTEAAQAALQRAADEADAPNATKAHAKAMLAQAELDNALARTADPQTGIEANNRTIARLIYEIGRLGQRIGETNSEVTAYQALEPVEARKLVKAATAAATGGADKTAWVGEPPVAVPTLSAVKQKVAALQDAAAKQQQHIESLQKQQKDVATTASQAAQKAETLSGKEGLQQFKQASDLRKQAAELANQIEVAQAKLVPIQQDLKLAEAQQAAVQAALQQFQQLGEQVETGWKSIQQQVARQQQLASAILNGSAGDIKTRESIADKAKQLAKQVADVTKSYTEAEESLNSAITHFEEAAAAATQLTNEIRPRISDLPADNAMKQALDTLMQVYNPVVFTLGQANAQLALGNLQSSRAQTMMERQKMLAALSETLQAANLEMPAELGGGSLVEQAKKLAAAANEAYKDAFENYSTVADSGAADADKNGGRAGRIFAMYGQALVARLTGNPSAKAHLATAISLRDAVLQEAPTAIAALPAELVVIGAATQPATAPAQIPAQTPPAPAQTTPTTPAPTDSTAPTEGAAPTDSRAPAPQEGAAPAPDGAAVPAEGAAPADPAAPAPADSALPPADGTEPPAPQ